MLTHKAIYTIGHSVHPVDAFVEMLTSFRITQLADIRSVPRSGRHPQFNRDALQRSLTEAGIQYIHIPALGGRRQVASRESSAKHVSGLQGYAAHMQSDEFKGGIEQLLEMATRVNMAYMCAEANWRNCHRSMVSDYLKQSGWQVIHITGKDRSELHPEPRPKMVQGTLF